MKVDQTIKQQLHEQALNHWKQRLEIQVAAICLKKEYRDVLYT
jgi:hypothetical protein